MMKIALVVLGIMLFLGLAGGLIGYGSKGTIQAACEGFGFGLLAVPYLVLIGGFTVSKKEVIDE